jgi:hypothetical protein
MLIFLDIDGVVVPAKSWETPTLLDDGFYEFTPSSIRVLQSISSDDTTIILTTSHKSRYTTNQWVDIFKTRGINIKIERLDDIKNLSRKEEIVNWFNTNTTNDKFVIIDDDKSLNDLPPFLKNNLVLTSSLIGLTDEHLEIINDLFS